MWKKSPGHFDRGPEEDERIAKLGLLLNMPPSGLVHRLRALEREHARDAWRKLDSRIPVRFKSKPHRNAGARALGERGRATADILKDCIAWIREIRSAEGSAAVPARGAAAGHGSSMASHALEGRPWAVAPDTIREGLLSARELFCVEVCNRKPLHRLATRRWMIRRVGKGAGKFLQDGLCLRCACDVPDD